MNDHAPVHFLDPSEPQLGQALAAHPRRIVIGIDSRLCLIASLGELPVSHSRQAMFYRLEEQVPFAAEDIWADFLATDSGVLGICTPEKNIAPVVTTLADAGASVAAICPTAMLSLQHAFDTGAIEPGRWDVLLWQAETEIEVYFLRGDQLIAWNIAPDEAEDVGRVLFAGAARLPTPLHVGAIAVKPALLDSLRDIEPGWIISQVALLHTWRESATLAAEAIAAGRASPMVDLRSVDTAAGRHHGRLSTPGRAAVAAFTILCAAVVFAMVFRGIGYHASASFAQDQTRQAFASVFPHAAIPVGIESRLRSTWQSLDVSVSASQHIGADTWLLPLLDHALRQLPADIRFSVDSLRLEDHQFVMEGQVLSFADADRIAKALRAMPGLTVDEPQTQRADSVVTFTLSGRLTEPQTSAGRAGK